MSIMKYKADNGKVIELKIYHTARKNIIVRIDRVGELKINFPPALAKYVSQWLHDNELKIMQLWQQAQQYKQAGKLLPTQVWYRGKRYPCAFNSVDTIEWDVNHGFMLPNLSNGQKRKLLKNWLKYRAHLELPARLRQWALITQLQPKAIALSQAKTFWGVCRSKTGIRLNWRLIGAPDFVIDYICIHELCHLHHPNHSQNFWSLVARYTMYTKSAKLWLRQYGHELFLLDS